MIRTLGPLLALALVACSGGGDKPADKPAESKPAAEKKAEPAAPTAEKKAEPAAAPAAEGAAAEAKTIFTTRCAACHGATGKGDGAAAANLPVKTRDYHDAAWQDSVQDDYLAKVIVEGGAAVGKSPLMTPNPDLKDKPEVVKEIIKLIRGFKGT